MAPGDHGHHIPGGFSHPHTKSKANGTVGQVAQWNAGTSGLPKQLGRTKSTLHGSWPPPVLLSYLRSVCDSCFGSGSKASANLCWTLVYVAPVRCTCDPWTPYCQPLFQALLQTSWMDSE